MQVTRAVSSGLNGRLGVSEVGWTAVSSQEDGSRVRWSFPLVRDGARRPAGMGCAASTKHGVDKLPNGRHIKINSMYVGYIIYVWYTSPSSPQEICSIHKTGGVGVGVGCVLIVMI